MRGIDDDLKSKNLKQVYLLYGPEKYLRKYYRNRIRKTLLGDADDDMNYTVIPGEKLDVNELIEQAETMPFFAERRMVYVENCGLFAKSDDVLADFLGKLPETVCLVFSENEVKKNTRTYKAVDKAGGAFEMTTLTDSRRIFRWLTPQMKINGKTLQIKKAAWEAFLTRTNGDMFRMQNEMEKLVSYCADEEFIDVKDVEAICTGVVEDKIFDMIRAVADRDMARAMRLYRDMLLLKEPAIKILILMTGQLRKIYEVKQMSAHHIGDDDIAKRLHMQGFAVRQNRGLGSNFTEKRLEEILAMAGEAEWDIKTGRLPEQMAVEILMTKIIR